MTESDKAKELYGEWFRRNPNLANPSDVNHKEKYDYMCEIGWENLRVMQNARKRGLAFTLRDYWRDTFTVSEKKRCPSAEADEHSNFGLY